MTPILFVHGWGFDARFWEPVAERLPDFQKHFIDFGFYGDEVKPGVERPLVVAHSLGLPWALANLDRPWAGLMAINGFARFTRSWDFINATAPRLVERMHARFGETPEIVAKDFLYRCGIDQVDLTGMKTEAMSKALGWLVKCDERAALAALDCPLEALAGTEDLIVPDPMSRDSFPPECLTLVEGAGHLLPLTHPEWVAARIRLFASGLS